MQIFKLYLPNWQMSAISIQNILFECSELESVELLVILQSQVSTWVQGGRKLVGGSPSRMQLHSKNWALPLFECKKSGICSGMYAETID